MKAAKCLELTGTPRGKVTMSLGNSKRLPTGFEMS